MTVCIGAICDNGKSAIVASDRMVTSNFPPIEFEHTKKKIFSLNEYCLALTAGNALKPIEVIPKIRSLLRKENTPQIDTIAEKAKELYQYLRTEAAEDYILKPRTMNRELFYTKGVSIFPPDLFNMIDHQFINYSYGLVLLIVGVDFSGAHIYTVRDPGTADCFDTIGFQAIGVGDLHASQSFIAHRYKISYNIEEALNIVYAAKKSAEVAPGVGSETDITLITDGKIIAIDQEIIHELSQIYNTVHKTPVDEIAEKSEQLKVLMEKRIESQKNVGNNDKADAHTNNKENAKGG